MIIHKSFADFVLFLYMHMAYSDGFFDPRERSVIKEKLSKVFPDANDHDEKINGAEKEYLALSKTDVAQVIKDTFHHFSSVKFALKYKVYTDMFDIIHADGKVEESETAALEELKKIIDISVEKTEDK